jgi:hypothetical protein
LECHKEVAQDLSGKHTVAHTLPANRELIRMKDVNKSFFGQSTNCTPCHSDPHKGQLGNECAKRHHLESLESGEELRPFEETLAADGTAHQSGLRKMPQTRRSGRAGALSEHEV